MATNRKPKTSSARKRKVKHDGLFGLHLFQNIHIIPKWIPTQRALWCHFYALAFSLMVLTPLTIMFFDRRQPVELELVKIENKNGLPEAREGDEVTVTSNATIIREGCSGELLRTIIDSANKITAFVREPTVFNNNNPVRGNITFSKTLTIPRGLTPGPALYVPRIERWCNPLQRYLWPIPQEPQPSIKFTVLP